MCIVGKYNSRLDGTSSIIYNKKESDLARIFYTFFYTLKVINLIYLRFIKMMNVIKI